MQDQGPPYPTHQTRPCVAMPPGPRSLLPQTRSPYNEPLIPTATVVIPQLPAIPTDLTITPSMGSDSYKTSLYTKHGILRDEYIALVKRHTQLSNAYCDRLSPGKNPTQDISTGVPCVVGLTDFLECAAGEMELLLAETNRVRDVAARKYVELMEVDRILDLVDSEAEEARV